jgi:hypothetical protein
MSASPLQLDQGADRVAGRRAVRVAVGRTVVALDDRDRPAGLQHAAQRGQGTVRVGQVLQQEADEDVVEARPRERQRVDVRDLEMHVAETRPLRPALRLQERLG